MRTPLTLLVLLFMSASQARAQSLEEQMRAMRAELEALRAEVQTLRQEVRGTMPVVAAQVEELAQTKVESTTKFPVKLSGTILASTFWNSNDTDWLDIPNLATSSGGGSFSSSLRQTRVGATVDGPKVGKFKTTGVLAMDFFGGITNFSTGQTMGVPRLLYGYMRLDGEKTAFEIGQDQMLFAPKNPTSLASTAFPSLYRSGNLYLRVPQLRVEQHVASGAWGTLNATAGLMAPIAGDLATPALQFVPPNLAGERSRKPAVQSRLSLLAPTDSPYDKPLWEFGVSGHYGQEKYGATTAESWAWSLDGDATLGRLGLSGEFYAGRNLDAFGSASVPFGHSKGGFAEARVAVTSEFSLNGGYGTDKLSKRTATGRQENSGFFWNGIYQFTPEFSGSLEYRRQRTQNAAVNRLSNNHFNLTFAYSF